VTIPNYNSIIQIFFNLPLFVGTSETLALAV
jgi:hypothetical protein